MSLWQRTIRISLAAVSATWICQLLGLQNPYASGIIALLSVFDTKDDAVKNAVARVLSTFVAFLIASLVFNLMGYSVLSFGVYLAVYVPAAYLLKLEAGLSPCSVLVTHFLIAESVAWYWQVNGLALMVIGVVMALVFNLWMPSYSHQIEDQVAQVEEAIRQALYLLASRLRTQDISIDEIYKQIGQANQELEALYELALREYKNQVLQPDDYYLSYVRMRRQQVNILSRMTESLPRIRLSTEANQLLADLFETIADEFNEANTGLDLLALLQQLYYVFRDSPLPTNRDEFESRAILYQMLIDVEQFLEIKRNFYMSLPLDKQQTFTSQEA